MTAYYPPWSFYYKVEFEGSSGPNEARFQSVSGLSVEYDTEEYKEGGENRFTHKLPVRTKYSDLVLKRGCSPAPRSSPGSSTRSGERIFEPRTVNVILMNEKSEPLRTWNVAHAVPKKWTVSDLNANENSIVVETLELTYQYFTVQ